MLRKIVCLGLLAFSLLDGRGAERQFDFGEFPVNETPPGFRSTVSGQGQPGTWKVVLHDVPPLLPPLSPAAPSVSKRAVLAQLSEDLTDEHFPLLIYEGESFAEFTLSTRFKIGGGVLEQMAGLAFRFQDEKNYYYVRASALGNNVRFFKVVDGQRSAPLGPELPVARGAWHELSVECKGNQIRCSLNGREVIPTMTDTSFSHGKFGFWTKSDSVAYFVDTRIVYKPREPLAQALVRETLQRYPRLVGLTIYARPEGANGPQVVAVASHDAKRIGAPGEAPERDVLERDSIYYGKKGNDATVTMPLRDRNGETVGAVRVTMKSFRGQTEQNAIARATPIVKEMELRIRSSQELLD
jgi:hypothetical protein